MNPATEPIPPPAIDPRASAAVYDTVAHTTIYLIPYDDRWLVWTRSPGHGDLVTASPRFEPGRDRYTDQVISEVRQLVAPVLHGAVRDLASGSDLVTESLTYQDHTQQRYWVVGNHTSSRRTLHSSTGQFAVGCADIADATNLWAQVISEAISPTIARVFGCHIPRGAHLHVGVLRVSADGIRLLADKLHQLLPKTPTRACRSRADWRGMPMPRMEICCGQRTARRTST